MARRYGLRASSNLADVADNTRCVENLGLRIADFVTIAGISATGVSAADFTALEGLRASLEAQITGLAPIAAASLSGLTLKALRTGDNISGTLIVSGVVSGDQAFIRTTGSGAIYGAASGSFFSPISGNTFSGGGFYRSGPTRISGLNTGSGLGNYTGPTFPWQPHYEDYKVYQRISNSSDTLFAIRTKLPPPTVFSGCQLWLDAEKSSFSYFAANRISLWSTLISGGPSAAQTTSGNGPYYLVSGIIDSGIVKPGVNFTGTDFFSFGSIGGYFSDAATVVVMAQVEDADYCLLTNNSSNAGRWRTSSGNGAWPLFCTSIIDRFPATMPANGTFAFSVRASQSYGLELRSNGRRLDYLAPSGFVYQAGGEYLLATAPGGAGRFGGKVFAVMAFNRILPDKELRTVEEYCLWRYNSVYNPDTTQTLQLEDGSFLQLETASGTTDFAIDLG